MKNKEGIYGFLKGKLAPKSWLIGAVMGSFGIDRGSNFAVIQPRFSGELAPIVGRSSHDRAAIMSHDRGQSSIHAVWWRWKRCSLDSAMEGAVIALDHGHDCTTIGSRSRRDQTVIASRSDRDRVAIGACFPPSSAGVAHPMEIGRSKAFQASPRWEDDGGLSWSSDGDRAITVCPRRAPRSWNREIVWPSDDDRRIQVIPRATKIARNRDRPMKRDEIATKIGRSWRFHVSSGKPGYRRHLTWFRRTWWFDDRVDSGPRDLYRSDRIQRPPCIHITCKR